MAEALSFIECSELVLLQNVEEVFALEDSIFWHVGAVDGILYSVVTKFGSKAMTEWLRFLKMEGCLPDCVWAKMLGNFWIVRSAKVAEGGNCVGLANFQSDSWAV